MLQCKCNKREIICCTLPVINETVVAIWRDGGSRKGGRTRGRKKIHLPPLSPSLPHADRSEERLRVTIDQQESLIEMPSNYRQSV